jgi:hypothetical protein
MKKKIAKGLLMLDLWLTIVATTVFVTLFYMDKVLYLNEIIIVTTSILSFNMICFILLSFNYPKQIKTFTKKDSKKY